MGNTLVSVIIPVYNGEKTLKNCLNNLLNQTYAAIEIIVVDDGSKDTTLTVAKNIAKQDSRVCVIHQENGGVSSARNTGIRYAKGEYVAFHDCDDTSDANFISSMVKAAETDSADLVISAYNTINQGIKISHRFKNLDIHCIDDLNKDFEYIYKNCFLNSPWNKLFRRNKISKFFRTDMMYFEDYYFVLDFLDCVDKIALVNIPTYNYIEDVSNSLTKAFNQRTLEMYYLIYNRQLEFCKNHFGNAYSELLVLSLIEGIYSSAQKIIYSGIGYRESSQCIKTWLEDERLTNSLYKDSNYNNIYKMCIKHRRKERRLGYWAIITGRANVLMSYLKCKQKMHTIVVCIKKMMRKRRK